MKQVTNIMTHRIWQNIIGNGSDRNVTCGDESTHYANSIMCLTVMTRRMLFV